MEKSSVVDLVEKTIRRAVGFIRRQKHNYRVAITRSAMNSFLLNLTAQYDSIYTVALGADSVELGTVSSIGNGISALISTPVGWLVDCHGLKPFYLLGMGIIATALKAGIAEPSHVRAAVEVMKTLNRKPAWLMQRVSIDAVTDVTGFALLGHAQEMAEKSGVGIRLGLERLPFLEGAKGYAEERIFPARAGRNQKCYAPRVRFAPSVPEWMQMLLHTPETSGGLLIAVPEKKLGELTALFDREGQSYRVIGCVVEGEGMEVGAGKRGKGFRGVEQ